MTASKQTSKRYYCPDRALCRPAVLCGVIGTGLFLGTANALRHGGPLGLLMGFAAMGSITFGVMVSLGEMIAALPIPGGHISLAQRFVNAAFFPMG